MLKQFRGFGAAALLAAVVLLALPALALAHETRQIGDYQVTVGWVNEPAYVNEPNKVVFRVANATTKQPVEGLEGSVKVDVSYGGKTQTFDLRPQFGQPGAYIAELLPTRTGDYVFHFTGSIEGVPLDATFDSADGKFGAVETLDTVAFPEAPVAVNQVQERVAGVSTTAEAARTSSQTALIVGIVGIVVGLLGLIVAGIALAAARRSAGAVQRPVSEPGRA